MGPALCCRGLVRHHPLRLALHLEYSKWLLRVLSTNGTFGQELPRSNGPTHQLAHLKGVDLVFAAHPRPGLER